MSALNPNGVDLTATDVASHLVVGKTHDLGTLTLPKSVTLPAGKVTEIDVPVTLKWSEVGVLAQLASSGSAVPFTVDGTLDMGGALHMGVPFHMVGAITREQLLGAAMNSMPFGK